MKKLLLLALALFSAATIQAQTSTPAPGDVRVPVVNSDGATYGEKALPFSANSVLAFGATPGSVTSVSLANFVTTATLGNYALASSVPAIRAGNVTCAAVSTKTVTFSSPFPAGTSYVVEVITNGLATSGYATSMSVSGFTLVLPLAVTGTISYIATPLQ